ncbi:acyl-CoA dehydrogenase family protein [Evansella tamaricis]|uniref:Acyl-CoA/acyl-ACP dehydrogenase n=1 Tax=Evansella tamaricis TaxID=2069301 RepID=A0ABS6JCV5_9BACI|nr:acyl-CoA dehydrogenase family protein [Evansella tamaricis]MBU9711416.1 acyl-CoA/acyl-ACP dehydrogenase [Evansella tamaricis]
MDKTREIFLRNNKHRLLIERAEKFVKPFQSRAFKYDKTGSFPVENFEELKTEGFTGLTVPKKYGGDEISLYEFLLVQETLAKGDGATALSLGWHNGTMMQLRNTNKWPEEKFKEVAVEAVKEHIIINTAATEAATGSPARGGKPETTATKEKNHWVVNGRKTFTSLAPILDKIIITATIKNDGAERVGEFLIPRKTNGVSFDETWDTLGMRATRSDDLILNNVVLSEDKLLATKDPGHGTSPQGWLLHIPACYLGIAAAAREEAISFAKEYQPNSLPHPISEVPEVKRKAATMDLELMKARHFMYHVALIWDEFPEKRKDLGAELAVVKTVCTNAAIEVVDQAMRIVGGQSLQRHRALERYYRDVRAGLHNPPSDDITMMILGKQAFKDN